LELENWEEDGLGKARGAFIRTKSMRVFLLRELAHIREHLGIKFSMETDAKDLADLGAAPLIDEVLEALGLERSTVDWTPGEVGRISAIDLLRRKGA